MALTRDAPDHLWARDMAAALQVGMIGFLVGGAALPMAYYDGFLTLIAMTVPLRLLMEAKLAPDARPKWLRLRAPAAPAAAEPSPLAR